MVRSATPGGNQIPAGSGAPAHRQPFSLGSTTESV